jgi:hypothetical protein
VRPRPEKISTAPPVAITQTAAATPMWTKLRLSRPNIGAMARGNLTPEEVVLDATGGVGDVVQDVRQHEVGNLPDRGATVSALF